MLKIILIYFLYFSSHRTEIQSFIPNDAAELYAKLFGNSINHMEITERAIDETVSKFMEDNGALFPSESQSFLNLFTYLASRETISLANSDVDMNPGTKNDPKFHFDNEEFNASNDNIIETRQLVVENIQNSNFVQARIYLGNILHTLQDFYSHSNWIELNNSKPFVRLGENHSIFPNDLVAGKNEVTCVNCKSPDGTCKNNLLSAFMNSKKLTTGYYAVPKAQGKCSHGGDFDGSRKFNATGGINKDSVSPYLSPHHYLHYDAADVAIKASKEFIFNLINEDNSQIWKAKMGTFFGLTSRLQKRDVTVSELFGEFQTFVDEEKVFIAFKPNATSPNTSFVVDSSVMKLKIVISSHSDFDVQIINPKNNSINSAMYSMTNINLTKTYEINSPIVGNWIVFVNTTSDYSIIINGYSRLFFHYKITTLNNGVVNGRLVTNGSYLVTFFSDEPISFKSISVELLAVDGATLGKSFANKSFDAFTSQIQVPNSDFLLKVVGERDNQETMERIISPYLQPSILNMTLKFENNTDGRFGPGSLVHLVVLVVNEGPTNVFAVEVSDSKNWSISQLTQNISLTQGAQSTLSFLFQIPNNTESFESSNVDIFFKLLSGRLENFGSSSILVYDKKTDHIIPTCSITGYTPSKDTCGNPNNFTTCLNETITVYLEVRDLESGLSGIKPQTDIPGASFKSSVYTEGTRNIVTANYTITCCNTSAVVLVSDMNNNVNHCNVMLMLSMAPGHCVAVVWFLIVSVLLIYYFI